MEQLRAHLAPALPSCVCLVLTSGSDSGRQFMRILPRRTDETLGFFPLVEVRLTLEPEAGDSVNIALVSFKREVLQRSQPRAVTDQDSILEDVQQYLNGTNYRLCQVSQRVSIQI